MTMRDAHVDDRPNARTQARRLLNRDNGAEALMRTLESNLAAKDKELKKVAGRADVLESKLRRYDEDWERGLASTLANCSLKVRLLAKSLTKLTTSLQLVM